MTLSNAAFFKMLHKAIVVSDARRQKVALVLKDRTFLRTIDQSYPARAILSVAAAHRTLLDQIKVLNRDDVAYEAWLETQAERAELTNA